jgi:hypothetical protein
MAFNHPLKQIKNVSAGSRDFLAYAEVLEGRRYVLVTRYRRRLETRFASSYSTPSCDGASLDTV